MNDHEKQGIDWVLAILIWLARIMAFALMASTAFGTWVLYHTDGLVGLAIGLVLFAACTAVFVCIWIAGRGGGGGAGGNGTAFWTSIGTTGFNGMQ